MPKVLHVVGARPNFMKAAPVIAAISRRGRLEQLLVHTGQHYDQKMSHVFFEELGMPEPDVNLEVGSGSHAHQTANIMKRLETVILHQNPDLVMVYGDVNSTVAASLVATKLNIAVGHVEAGLRSFDRSMPEEINRLLTDQMADLLLTPSKDGDANLRREGVPPEKIHQVGNVMIDTLMRLQPLALDNGRQDKLRERFFKSLFGHRPGVMDSEKTGYALVTMHRPSNVDDRQMLIFIMQTLEQISRDIPVIFPLHPRTRALLESERYASSSPSLLLIEPLGYLDFLCLQAGARMVITDSGGVQEETTFLGVPCLTIRDNTERPVTVEIGTNILVGRDMDKLMQEARRILEGRAKAGNIPPLWDGRAAERIANIVEAIFC